MNYQLEKQMKGLSLQEVTRENWRDTLSLNVFPEQQRFIADYVPIAAIALAKAYIRPGGLVWVPYAFYAKAEMVGFTEVVEQSYRKGRMPDVEKLDNRGGLIVEAIKPAAAENQILPSEALSNSLK